MFTHQQQTAFENIVGIEEIARKEQFLLFPQCFFFFFTQSENCIPIYQLFLTYLYLVLNWKSPKLAFEVKC